MRSHSQRRLAGTTALRLGVVLLTLIPAIACAQEAGGRQDDPFAALRSGAYEDAVRGFERTLAAGLDAAAVRGLADALEALGRYDEAEEHLRAHVQMPGAPAALGRLLVTTGRLDEAEALLTDIDRPGSPDRLQARLWLGRIEMERGQRQEALERFDTFIDEYNGAASLTASDLAAVGHAVRYLGARDPDLFQDALRAFDEALAADQELDEAQIAIGDLFLEKHNSGEAKAAFRAVLARNPNHPEGRLGIARAARFDGSREAMELTRGVLETNKSLIPALVFHGLLLLELEDTEAATAEAEKALAVNPRSLEARSVRATSRLLSRDRSGFEAEEAAILELNPSYTGLYSIAAELLAQQRQYSLAAELAAKGVALNPEDPEVRGHLAFNQLRIGEMEEGRSNLEEAFQDDRHNVWYFNTLELLDDLATFRTVDAGDFQLVLHEREADLLAPYVAHYAQEALDELSERYGARPPTPIRLEVFPSHADFSVRTVGLAGLGALGVSFGRVLAMDSPSARDAGAFNWASTLWHEVAHSVHMGLSEHRVPRWFTEGCAVYEQRRARQGWGDPVSPTFVAAIREEKLHPVSRLNEGFVRPSYPEHVVHSYFQASLVCEWIEETHGFDALRQFLIGYASGKSSETLFREVLDMEPGDLDRDFDSHLRGVFAAAIESTSAGPAEDGAAGGGFRSRMTQGMQAFEAGDMETAKEAFERAAELFPQYGGQDGPHRFLARILEREGDSEGAIREWRAQLSLNENDRDAATELARLYEAAGESSEAADALVRVIEISPYDPDLHRRLAGLYQVTDQHALSVRERTAVLAQDPVDRAEALYELARAHWAAGQVELARTRVLESLELAPGYSDALDLLLEIRGRGT